MRMENAPVNYSCSAYGLAIHSSVLIPGLPPEAEPLPHSDVSIAIDHEEPAWVRAIHALRPKVRHLSPDVADTGNPVFTLTEFGGEEFFELAYADGTRFVVDGSGTKMWGTFEPPLTIADLASYLLGPVMGFVLRQRGIAALHGSCVSVNGRAAIICGPADAGKSTTAAAMGLRGASVLCDDISPLFESAGDILVAPAYPRLCLWPGSADVQAGSREALPHLSPNWNKRYLTLDGERAAFDRCRRPLAAIYLLVARSDSPDAPSLAELSPKDALLGLIENTYMNALRDNAPRAREFELLGNIAATFPVRRVTPHSDPARIGALCELLFEDLARIARENRAPAHATPR